MTFPLRNVSLLSRAHGDFILSISIPCFLSESVSDDCGDDNDWSIFSSVLNLFVPNVSEGVLVTNPSDEDAGRSGNPLHDKNCRAVARDSALVENLMLAD